MIELLKEIYGSNIDESLIEEYEQLFSQVITSNTEEISYKNAYLITYGDSITSDAGGINTVAKFFKNTYGGKISDIHILPMYPYTSDDGFSVVDFLAIDEAVGSWQDIKNVGKDYRLMFDFVANHISQESIWFKNYLAGEPYYQQFFTEKEEGFDYSKVVRPRALPLFYEYSNGKEVWATFSKDQVDINFSSPYVLLELTKVLVEYLKNGATSIRLDAIGFIWKESGTTCIHLDKAHKIVKLWRLLIEKVAPNVQIITETNVPHLENISYFGNGSDEANQVYQFTLPPITMHTFLTGDASAFNEWAKSIKLPSSDATFFNFLASHDGIGMRPVEGILSIEQVQNLISHSQANGGKLGLKNQPDGTTTVYELNCTYFDAIRDANMSEEQNIQRFLAAHFILMSFVGVPALYFNSLVGSTNDYEGVKNSGINRRINRQKFQLEDLELEIGNSPFRQTIIKELNNLLAIRTTNGDFDPYINQEILGDDNVIIIKRKNTYACVNITNSKQYCNISGFNMNKEQPFSGELAPYEYAWVKIND